MKRIVNDTVYHSIEYSRFEEHLFSTKLLNRLHFITQNAIAYFAFPSITTKRYIHSLGTMHMSSILVKNAFNNANKIDMKFFLASFMQLLKELGVDSPNVYLELLESEGLEEGCFHESNERAAYMIMLQAVRIAGLMHDLGHLPFSHQIEYALESFYWNFKKEAKESAFLHFYETWTDNESVALHEKLSHYFMHLIFEKELGHFDDTYVSYSNLLLKIVSAIYSETTICGFDCRVLHNIIDSTVDADRLDYIVRDMQASDSGVSTEAMRIASRAIFVRNEEKFYFTFCDMALSDIEHLIEQRFVLYKKVIYQHDLAKSDGLLEFVIQHLMSEYIFENTKIKGWILPRRMSVIWEIFSQDIGRSRLIALINQLDENWLNQLLKENYFKLIKKKKRSQLEKKYLLAYEEVLFGQHRFISLWKNLNNFYNVLGLDKQERYAYRESFMQSSKQKKEILKSSLDNLVNVIQQRYTNVYLTYQIVHINIGIGSNFSLYDGEKLVQIDEVSTLRKRLKMSLINTVPFYLYSNDESLCDRIKEELLSLIQSVYVRNQVWIVL